MGIQPNAALVCLRLRGNVPFGRKNAPVGKKEDIFAVYIVENGGWVAFLRVIVMYYRTLSDQPFNSGAAKMGCVHCFGRGRHLIPPGVTHLLPLGVMTLYPGGYEPLTPGGISPLLPGVSASYSWGYETSLP